MCIYPCAPGAENGHSKLSSVGGNQEQLVGQQGSKDWSSQDTVPRLVEVLCEQMARLPHRHTSVTEMLSHAQMHRADIQAHVHSTPPPRSHLSLSWKTLRNGHYWTCSPSRLKSLRQSFLRSRNAYQFTLTISPSLTVFEES